MRGTLATCCNFGQNNHFQSCFSPCEEWEKQELYVKGICKLLNAIQKGLKWMTNDEHCHPSPSFSHFGTIPWLFQASQKFYCVFPLFESLHLTPPPFLKKKKNCFPPKLFVSFFKLGEVTIDRWGSGLLFKVAAVTVRGPRRGDPPSRAGRLPPVGRAPRTAASLGPARPTPAPGPGPPRSSVPFHFR